VSTVVSAEPRRVLELSPAAFRRLAWWTVGWLLLIVATGATVRLTGSGLGCRHWPGCTPSSFIPKQGYHSDVEFSNRVVAALTVFTTLAFAFVATFQRLPRRTKTLAWIVFVGTAAQAPLGAITVHYDLNPYLVLSHLLLSLVVLGIGVLVTVQGTGTALPARARQLGALLLSAVSFLVVTGTLATAAGKFPGSSGDTAVERVGRFFPAVYLHVRAVAAFGICFLLLAGWAWLNRERHRWLLRGCAGLLAILLVQMGIGEAQYRMYGTIPWWVVMLHVLVAACLFGWTVGVVGRLWRPPAD
jgi:cytochrome c oxidase assembly protein subunit 15